MVAVGLGQHFSCGKFLDDIGHLLYVIATFLNEFKVFLKLLGRLDRIHYASNSCIIVSTSV